MQYEGTENAISTSFRKEHSIGLGIHMLALEHAHMIAKEACVKAGVVSAIAENIFIKILIHTGAAFGCFPSIESICDFACCSPAKASAVITAFVNAGVITRHARYRQTSLGAKRTSNEYEVPCITFKGGLAYHVDELEIAEARKRDGEEKKERRKVSIEKAKSAKGRDEDIETVNALVQSVAAEAVEQLGAPPASVKTAATSSMGAAILKILDRAGGGVGFDELVRAVVRSVVSVMATSGSKPASLSSVVFKLKSGDKVVRMLNDHERTAASIAGKFAQQSAKLETREATRRIAKPQGGASWASMNTEDLGGEA